MFFEGNLAKKKIKKKHFICLYTNSNQKQKKKTLLFNCKIERYRNNLSEI